MWWCWGKGTSVICWRITRPTTTGCARTLRSTRMLRSIDLRRQSGLSHQSLGSAVSIGTTFGWHNRYTQELLRPPIRIESCNQWISCNYCKCQWRRAGKDTLPPDPAPTRNPDPACAPTPAGTPAPARMTPAPARTPTPAGTPAPPAAVPAAAAVPTPTAMPARSVAPGMSGAEIGRGGKGGEGDDNHHQEFTCHRTLLSRPPIGAGPSEV